MKRIYSYLRRAMTILVVGLAVTTAAIEVCSALPALHLDSSAPARAAGLTIEPANLPEPSIPLTGAGSAFTYQGRLKVGNVPANGPYDLVFTLYDAPSGGSPVSIPVTDTNQAVSDGLFTASLDFGGQVFDGNSRFLELAVRPSGQGAYITLSPRQPLTPAPYALFALRAQGPENVVLVARSGGQFTSVQAAIASITGNSPTNRYLVKIAPGVYTETVAMKPYVDIEGSGEATTRITFTGTGLLNTGTVVGASNAELRSLTVENTGGNYYAIAIYNAGTSPSLLDVTAITSGQANTTYGVYNHNAAPTMTNVTVTASGGNSNDYGVYNYNSSPPMTGVTAIASGSPNNYGVYNAFNSSPAMTGLRVTASGGNYSYGIFNDISQPRITTSNITAAGGGSNIGVYSTSGPVLIDGSTVTASTHTIAGIGPTHVGASKLDGGPALGAVCAGVYNANYSFYAGTCP